MSLNRFLKRAALAAAGFALISGAVPASGIPGGRPAKTPGDRAQVLRHDVSVIMKLVRVVVRDREGRTVMDLTKDDFTLLDENVPQKITGFEVYKSAPAPAPAAKAAAAPVAPAVKTEPPPTAKLGTTPLPSPKDLSRTFFILIDANLNDVWGIGRSCEAAKKFIRDRVLESDELGLICIRMDGGLDLRVSPTRDRARVLAELGALGAVPGMLPTPERDAPPKIFIPFAGGSEEDADMLARRMAAISSMSASLDRMEAMDHKQRAQVFARCLSDLAKSMRRQPGTKNLILFSQGIPKSFLVMNKELNERLVDASRELAAADMPLFSVNTRSGTSESFGAGGGESLRTMSELTGGRAFDEGGAIAKFDRWAAAIDEDTRNFYVLGYSVEAAWDGAFRKIQVRVRRPGCAVRVQAGYYNPRAYSKFSEHDKRVQLLDLALDENSEDRLPIDLYHAVRPAEPNRPAALLVTIPVSLCRTRMSSKAELHLLAFDAGRRIAASYRRDVDLAALPDKKSVAFTLEGLKPGFYDVAIILRDAATGKGAVATGAIQIGAANR